jgi:hypothetical protein
LKILTKYYHQKHDVWASVKLLATKSNIDINEYLLKALKVSINGKTVAKAHLDYVELQMFEEYDFVLYPHYDNLNGPKILSIFLKSSRSKKCVKVPLH